MKKQELVKRLTELEDAVLRLAEKVHTLRRDKVLLQAQEYAIQQGFTLIEKAKPVSGQEVLYLLLDENNLAFYKEYEGGESSKYSYLTASSFATCGSTCEIRKWPTKIAWKAICTEQTSQEAI